MANETPQADAREAWHDQALAGLRALVGAGRDGELGVQAWVEGETRALGCHVERRRYTPADVSMVGEFAGPGAIDPGERETVLATLRGCGGGRSLILFAHPDCEPPARLGEWRHDPFAAVVDGGRVFGWGVADDLAGIAAMVEGVRIARAAGFAPAGDVILAATPSKRHARGVSALLRAGVSADAALYLHPAESGAGLGEIKAFASGQLEFRIEIEGREPDTTEPLQTAFAHRAVNPIEKALVVVAALRDLADRRAEAVRHPALHAAVGRSTNLMVSHIQAGDPERLSRGAGICHLGAALAFPPPETLASVQAAVTAAVDAACAADPWLRDHPARIAWVSGVTGAETSPDHPLFRVAAEAVLAVTGRVPYVNPMHTGSDIRNPIVQAGIPTIGLGPLCGDLAQNGCVDEWVDAADYLRTVAIVARIVAAWCGPSARS